MRGTQLELNGHKRDAGFHGDPVQQGPLPVPPRGRGGRRGAWRPLLSELREAEAPSQSYVSDADDSTMSGAREELLPVDATAAACNSSLNGSEAPGLQELHRTEAALFEFQVFTITLAVLALCILAFTGLYCITVCFHRNRQSKRAHAYESAVTRGAQVDPVAVRAVKRSTSFINALTLFRRAEGPRDKSRIYYIYSNPLPIGLEDEEEQEEREAAAVAEEEEERGKERKKLRPREAPSRSLLIQKYAEDPNSGVTLDPPMFYMQL